MQKLTIILLILSFGTLCSYGQTDHKELYRKAFEEQHQMLKEEIPIDFKRAVFITENAYHKGTFEYGTFKNEISQIGNKLKSLIRQRGLTGYKTAGKVADYLYPGTPKDFNIIMYNNITKIKTAQDIKNIRDNINKVMMERPKF